MPLNRLGLIKTSLIDYPGEVASVVFTPGCNLRCPFCHNPELVEGPMPEEFLPAEEVLAFLSRRSTVLGGVCVTGGEPLYHTDLDQVINPLRGMDLKVKIDTNGTYPDRLRDVTPDYVALDIKTSPSRYGSLRSGAYRFQRDLFADSQEPDANLWSRVEASIEWLLSAGIPVEFRTTVVPGLVSVSDIETITGLLAGLGGNVKYVLAGFRPGTNLDPAYAELRPYGDDVLKEMHRLASAKGLDCTIRWNRIPTPPR